MTKVTFDECPPASFSKKKYEKVFAFVGVITWQQ
jgi:hypothetical protein